MQVTQELRLKLKGQFTKLTVQAEVTPGEAPSWDSPGEPISVDVEEVWLRHPASGRGRDILPGLSDGELVEIEQALLGSLDVY